ncbi:MAG: hypothetical protein VX278_11830 [Myxococcota bacterium]|nr:hypothetical protein [Myxococcota bacterium]
MNRVKTAIEKNRCVFAISPSLTKSDGGKVIGQSVPTILLDEKATGAFKDLSQESLQSAQCEGGIFALVEPDLNKASISKVADLVAGMKPAPQLFIIAKSYNRFSLPLSLQLKKIQHIKMRGDLFLKEIAASTTKKKEAPKAKAPAEPIKAPSSIFLGRTEEVASLKEYLQNPGRPIFIYGPSGIGKHWLLEYTLEAIDLKLTHVPEIRLGREVGLDTLLSRIAVAAPKGNPLFKALNSREKRPNPEKITELVVQILQSDEMANTLFVISDIEFLLDVRDNSFYKEKALELCLKTLISSELKARVVLLCNQKFQTYNPDLNPRFIQLLGLKEDVWKSFFTEWRLNEEQIELAMKLADRTHGHPVGLRSLAVSIKSNLTEEQLENSTRGKLENIYDTNGPRRLLRKMFDKASKEHKILLNSIALMNMKVDVEFLQRTIEMNRKTRVALVAQGLLEQSPSSKRRLYSIHPLTKSLLKPRNSDFSLMHQIALELQEEARRARNKSKDFNTELALIQNSNLLFTHARKRKDCWRTSVSCLDHVIQLIRRLTFANKNYDAASKILASTIKQSPNHPDLLLLELQLSRKLQNKKSPPIQQLHKIAGTPETYHYEATLSMDRGKIKGAISALEAGIKVFPNNARICRRLSSLYLRQSNTTKAKQTIEKAQTLQPLMPDNYSLLGETLTQMGKDHWEAAEAAFAKAKELGGDNPPHLVRYAKLLRLRALNDPQQSESLLTQCKELLQQAHAAEENSINTNIALATVLLDLNEDLDLVEKHLKPAMKYKDRADTFIQKARWLGRKKELEAAHISLNKAYKLSSDNHFAFFVRGELFFAENELLKAYEAFKMALERTPQSSAEFAMYTNSISKMEALIELEANRDEEQPTETEIMESTVGFRRDPGLIIRRKSEEDEDAASTEEPPQ